MSPKFWKIILGFAIPLAILSVVLLVFGKTKEYVEKEEKYITIVDAGGSGTRLSVYKFNDDDKVLEEHSLECEEQGLQNWASKDFPQLESKLDECYKKGNKFLPENAANTPIVFGATAGMRLSKLRDINRYTEIWKMVNRTLAAGGYKVLWSDVFPGKYEARFSWIAANVLKHTTKKDFTGMTEMGSSSVQMAFVADERADPKKNIDKIEFFGQEIPLYEYSYLCYGEVEVFRRYHAVLVKNANFSTDIIDDPCTNLGYNWTKSADYLWKVPCVKGDYAKKMFGSSISGPQGDNTTYRLTGTGNPQECMKVIQGMIPTKCTNGSECGMDDVAQPKVHGKYLALSLFQYLTTYMGLPSGGGPNEYLKKSTELCSTPYDELAKKYIYNPEKYKSKRCFQSVYTYFLLKDGLKFNKDTWNIEYSAKIDGKKVQWTLGAAYEYLDDAYHYKHDDLQPKMYTLFIVGVVLLVVAIVAIFVSIVFMKRSTSYEQMS